MQRAAGAVAAACVLLSAGGTVLQWWRTASEATTAAGREHGRCHGALTVITIEAFTQMVESGVRLWQRAQLPLVRRGLVPHANLSESMLHPCIAYPCDQRLSAFDCVCNLVDTVRVLECVVYNRRYAKMFVFSLGLIHP